MEVLTWARSYLLRATSPRIFNPWPWWWLWSVSCAPACGCTGCSVVVAVADRQIIPERLLIKYGDAELYWSESADLVDAIHWANRKHGHKVPINAEDGYVLVALGVDGSYDEIISCGGTGAYQDDPVELLTTAWEHSHEAARAVEKVMTGRDRPSTYDLNAELRAAREMVERIRTEIQVCVEQLADEDDDYHREILQTRLFALQDALGEPRETGGPSEAGGKDA